MWKLPVEVGPIIPVEIGFALGYDEFVDAKLASLFPATGLSRCVDVKGLAAFLHIGTILV